MSYDCRGIANAILDFSDDKSLQLTHMAIHKLMYYAHGWYLAKYDKPFIEQDFEAWKDGPVQRLVWESLRASGSSPVKSRAAAFDLVKRRHFVVKIELPKDQLSFLKNITRAYGVLHAFELSRMTHEKNSPWDQVWNASSGKITLGMQIPNDKIRDYFLKSPPSSHSTNPFTH